MNVKNLVFTILFAALTFFAGATCDSIDFHFVITDYDLGEVVVSNPGGPSITFDGNIDTMFRWPCPTNGNASIVFKPKGGVTLRC
jgi:hypothetical protein